MNVSSDLTNQLFMLIFADISEGCDLLVYFKYGLTSYLARLDKVRWKWTLF